MIRPRIRRGIIYVTTRDGRAATFGKLFTYGGGRAVGLGSACDRGWGLVPKTNVTVIY